MGAWPTARFAATALTVTYSASAFDRAGRVFLARVEEQMHVQRLP